MKLTGPTYAVSFAHSKEQRSVAHQELAETLVDFLAHFGEEALVGPEFSAIIKDGDGPTRLKRLLKACGHPDDLQGFFTALLNQLGAANGSSAGAVEVGGIAMPHLLLVALLEKIVPGNKFITINHVAQLEKLANITIPEADKENMQQVIDTYPVRVSMHTIRQMRVSKAVAYQYLPFIEELDPVGHVNTWIGQFHQGLLEQMYQNRVIFLLNMSCPVYCRFCFRKHKDSRNQTNPSSADVDRAVDHIRNSPLVKEIVLTGGDPFLNRTNLVRAVEGLSAIDHVQTLRLATRSIAYYPHLFTANDGRWLNTLKEINIKLILQAKRLEIATHFIHPDEISPQSLEIISELVKNGIPVYIQTPFLKNCNDRGPELVRLFSLLRGAGAELHYIYIPCSPIQGNSIYWTPISTGLDAAVYLRAHLSDRVIPRICTATPIGKIDWYTSGWAVGPDEQNDNFFWIRTPYTPGYFKAFAPLANELDIVKVNDEGTIDVRYMAKLGDDSLHLGPRPTTGDKPNRTSPAALKEIREWIEKNRAMDHSMVATESPTLARTHATRVEIDIKGGDADFDIISRHKLITDVVVTGQKDCLTSLDKIERIMERLAGIHHVNAVRLRNHQFTHAPETFTLGAVDRLAALNRLSVVNPLRLEIETQFLHADEFNERHVALARTLRNKGITVYSNTPLLTGVNDHPDEINRIAYHCRRIDVEFHHLYVAGLPAQRWWNEHRPVDVDDVIDVGTRVRRDGSGREIPRYIISTWLGEVDFGLTARLIAQNGALSVKLMPYDLEYYRRLDAGFTWPDVVSVDSDGKPVLPLVGLTSTSGFMVTRR